MGMDMEYLFFPFLIVVAIVLILLKNQETGCSNVRLSNKYENHTVDDHSLVLSKINALNIRKQALLNFEEKKIFWKIKSILVNSGLFLYAQVNLGEILYYDDSIKKQINCKRVDFCIVNQKFMPIAVVEYSGSGHNQDELNTERRDEIKEHACKKAGVIFITVTSESETELMLRNYLQEYIK